MKGLKNHQDMMYIKQDRIQSTMAEDHASSQDFQLASKEASLLYSPSPGLLVPLLQMLLPHLLYIIQCQILSAQHIWYLLQLQQVQDTSAILESVIQGSENLTQEKSYSELIGHDASSTFSDEEIRSTLSLDCSGNPGLSATQSGVCPAAHTAQLIQRVTSEKRSDHGNPLTDHVYSNSLIDPNVVK